MNINTTRFFPVRVTKDLQPEKKNMDAPPPPLKLIKRVG
jgi:hypothetical protein